MTIFQGIPDIKDSLPCVQAILNVWQLYLSIIGIYGPDSSENSFPAAMNKTTQNAFHK